MRALAEHKINAYGGLAVEMAIDLVIMYLVMYSMITSLDHFYFNINNVYMTLMMLASMTNLMLVGMRSMFPSQRTNIIVGAVIDGFCR